MADERIGGIFNLSAELIEQKLDGLADKLRTLAGGAKINLELRTAEAETRLNALGFSMSQGTAKVYKSYQDAIGELKALKALSRLTYEQELSYLEGIRAGMDAYGLSAKEALDLERRLLAVRAEIAARDASSLNTLLSGITNALETRYEAMRDAELTMLSDSREAWQAWKDDSTGAIQAQIAALDEQAEAVNSAYAAQLEAAALQAEAQQRLMTGTQEELLKLITDYAPGYNAAGQTLGEQLLSGFAEKVGGVADWMESLNAMILGVQQSLNASLQSASNGFYQEHSAAATVTITQQNTFYTPVETPSETASRIKQANEQLAEQLIGS